MPGIPPTGGDIIDAASAHGRYWSAKDICNLARDAGFRDDEHPSTKASELAVAVAIALAESGGDSQAEGPAIEHGTAKGLWQIYPADETMFDPKANATAAWNKYVGAGHKFTPWSTYNSKAYLVKLPAAEVAVRTTHRDRPGFTRHLPTPFGFIGDIAKDLATFFGIITSFATWARVMEVVGGGVLFLVALWILFGETRVGARLQGQAIQAGGAVAGTGAKAAKAV